jgi:hypothetical protein
LNAARRASRQTMLGQQKRGSGMFSIFSILEKLMARWQDTANFLLGVCLIISPGVLAYFDQMTAAWNASLTGFAIALVAASTLEAYHDWKEWIMAVFAGWLIASPYILGFSTMQVASWTHIVAGVLVAVLALWSAIAARATDGAASKRWVR